MISQLSYWLVDIGQSMSGVSLCLLASFLALCGYYCYNYFFSEPFSWEKYGVPHVQIQWATFVNFREGYRKLLEGHGDTVGFFRRTPQLVTIDRALLRQILVKDFSNFVDRSRGPVSNCEIINSLFFSAGRQWKRKRQLLSPSFSTAKLKLITKIIHEKAKRLRAYMADCAEKNRLAAVKQTSGQYAAEVIAQTAFGCQIDCLGSGQDDEFAYKCQHIISNPGSKYQRLIRAPVFHYHWLRVFLVKILRISFFDLFGNEATGYFRSLILQGISQRQSHIRDGKPVPMDFLQLFYDKSVKNEEGTSTSDSDEKQMTLSDVIGELLLIILAGFETTSTTLQFVFYFLAAHQEIQEKVLQEIQEKVKDDTPTHEEISQLTYTKQVIDETLRLCPPAPVLNRVANEERKYGGITIPAKTSVAVPIFLLQRDPKLYPDPDVFDPDRFSDEQVAQREPFTFMPFGGGPRLCLGMRLAYIQMKLALVYTLRKVKVTVNDRTTPPAGESFKLSLRGMPVPVEAIKVAVELRK